MEDVWLGSLLYRFPPADPIRYVSLSELIDATFVSDEWGFRATPTALLVHLRAKSREIGRFRTHAATAVRA